MNPVFKLFFVFVGFVMMSPDVAAEEWRGIKPLSSTREDVVRVFGECAGERDWCEFTADNEDVMINFSGPASCNNLPPDTVLSLERELRNATTFEALHIDKRRFKSFDPAIPRNRGYRGFIDEKTGLLLKTFRGEVFQINYIAAKKDWPVCPDFYRRPREFVAAIFEHVPSVNITCPKTNPSAGEKVPVFADFGRTGLRITVFWFTSAGRIIEGQNTRKILLDTTGLEGKTITVQVERGDSLEHVAAASCSFSVSAPPKN